MVQWLGLGTCIAKGLGLILVGEVRSHNLGGVGITK